MQYGDNLMHLFSDNHMGEKRENRFGNEDKEGAKTSMDKIIYNFAY